MTARTWAQALTRATRDKDLVPQLTANIAVLTQLRERWRDSVDIVPSMFDLVMVPLGTAWPTSGDGVFVRMSHAQRAGEPVIEVMLFRSTDRESLTRTGGTVLVAGDVCRIENAPAVVEAFLYQIARPANSADTACPV
jgi:hypothetical protein